MEQKCGNRLPPLCAKYPWLVSQDLENEEDNQFFYTIHDPLLHYQCRIPELVGKRIRGCFFGWVILSNNITWSLWNPVTCEIIHLPPLILKDGDCDDIRHCCLSSPPDDPTSVLLLTRAEKPSFVFCWLDGNGNSNDNGKRKRLLGWSEMSYVKQLKRLSFDGSLIYSLTPCDGKIFALNNDGSLAHIVMQIDIVVKDTKVAINLVLFGACPITPFIQGKSFSDRFLKGSCSELFCIIIDYNEETKKTIGAVSLFKLDMTSIKWEELECLKDWDVTNIVLDDMEAEDIEELDITCDMWEEMLELKDAIFYVDIARDYSVFYTCAIASKLGGYIHIRDEMGRTIHSYCVSDKTISLSSMPCSVLPTSHVSLWECRLEGDYADDCTQEEENRNDKMVVRRITDDEVKLNESYLLNLPFHVLEKVMEFSVGVEYMNFRATCKRCHLAAPVIQWRNESTSKRLHNYSLVSPWLMVVDEKQGMVTFTDPMFGDKYFMRKLQVSIEDNRICCSMFGWVLFYSYPVPVFYNPFTSDILELPDLSFQFGSFCFSAPPTSPDCMVVAIEELGIVHIHFVGRERSWRELVLDFGDVDPYPFNFPTFYGRDLYALCNEGQLQVFKDLDKEYYSWEKDIVAPPRSCCTSRAQHYLTKCDQHPLLVIVGVSGESVEVFKLNDSIKEWEKIYSLGSLMIYISGTTCICIEAKSPHMENKIYFPQLHSKNTKNRRIVFYSLETCTYGTFDRKNNEENFERKSYHLRRHAWIEPNWS